MINSDPVSKIKSKVLPTKAPVSRSEIRQFQQINRDEALIEAYAHYARLQMSDFSDLPDDQISVLFIKEQTYDTWRQHIGSTLLVTTMGSRWFNGSDHTFTNISNAALSHSDNFSNWILKYVPIDLTLESDEIVEADQQIIIPEDQDEGIVEFLQEIKVPPGLAADAQSIIVNGFSFPSMTNFALKIFNTYQTNEPEDTKGCGATFADKRRAAKAAKSGKA